MCQESKQDKHRTKSTESPKDTRESKKIYIQKLRILNQKKRQGIEQLAKKKETRERDKQLHT